MAITEEQIKALEAQHRRVKHVRINDIDLVLRAPKRHEYKRFRSQAHGEQRADAQEDLMRLIVVHPSPREAFDTLLEDYPGLCEHDDVTKAIKALTGVGGDPEGKGSGTSAIGNGGIPTTSPTG